MTDLTERGSTLSFDRFLQAGTQFFLGGRRAGSALNARMRSSRRRVLPAQKGLGFRIVTDLTERGGTLSFERDLQADTQFFLGGRRAKSSLNARTRNSCRRVILAQKGLGFRIMTDLTERGGTLSFDRDLQADTQFFLGVRGAGGALNARMRNSRRRVLPAQKSCSTPIMTDLTERGGTLSFERDLQADTQFSIENANANRAYIARESYSVTRKIRKISARNSDLAQNSEIVLRSVPQQKMNLLRLPLSATYKPGVVVS